MAADTGSVETEMGSENPKATDSEVTSGVDVEDSDSVGGQEQEDADDEQTVENKKLDDDLDRRNPQYIPKVGAFYEHDNRTLDTVELEESAEAKKKTVWKESKKTERWMHDCYVEDDQGPKTTQELIDVYGYDIRNEEIAPRARRRRRYGRGPDKYDRKWDDEGAYSQKGLRGRPPNRKNEEDFPPLPNQKNGHAPVSTSWREGKQAEPRGPPRNAPSASVNPTSDTVKPKPRLEDNIKPFRNDSGPRKSQDNRDLHKGRSDARPQPSYTEQDLHEITREVSNINIQQKPKPKVPEPKKESPEQNRNQQQNSKQNPKRYSKISKGFYFPPDAIPTQLQATAAALSGPARSVPHVQQPQQRPDGVIVQNVGMMQRYPDSFNGNPPYLPGRTILQPMAQPGLTTPATIPQTLSPQLQGMDMSPQSGFVASPLYIDMVQGEVVPFQGYPYPQGQSTELYQTSGQAMPSGITYYSPEIQGSVHQQRALPLRRKAAIPIVPPPDAH